MLLRKDWKTIEKQELDNFWLLLDILRIEDKSDKLNIRNIRPAKIAIIVGGDGRLLLYHISAGKSDKILDKKAAELKEERKLADNCCWEAN